MSSGGRVIRPLVEGMPGGPRIVLAHGLEDSWNSWRGLTEHCDPWWRVEALDLPWRAGNDYRWRSRDTAAGWLTRALDALDGPPDVFVGHSYAANAALELLAAKLGSAASGPADGHRAFGLVLVCPLYRPPSVEVSWKLFDASRANFEAHMRESIRARMGRRRDLVPADVLATMMDKALDRVGPNGLLAAFDRYVASGDIPLETIDVPIAILGGGSDLTLSVAAAQAMAARLPAASLTVGDDLDHFCHVRRPGDVVAHIRDFVRANVDREPAHAEGAT